MTHVHVTHTTDDLEFKRSGEPSRGGLLELLDILFCFLKERSRTLSYGAELLEGQRREWGGAWQSGFLCAAKHGREACRGERRSGQWVEPCILTTGINFAFLVLHVDQFSFSLLLCMYQ